ncbi:MAG: folate-binding protein [Chloroflexota bacterium]|nr:folate-binding protein [Chloroflexota bacterium]
MTSHPTAAHSRELTPRYTDTTSEYRAALEGAALHDASRFGRLRVTGVDALDLLNRLSTNRLDRLSAGESAMTVLVDEKARIIDLLTVANLGDELLIFTSPGAAQRVVQWLDKYTFAEEIAVQDVTDSTAMLSLLGPESPAVLARLPDLDMKGAAPNTASRLSLDGVAAILVRRDAPWLPSWDLVVPAGQAARVWDALAGAGATPMGEEAWQALRVERGVPIHGHELTEQYNPLEAGLAACVSFDKGCYIGQEVIARLDTYKKLQRRLVRLRFPPGAAVAEGDALEQGGKRVGVLTSVATRPADGAVLAIGYVRLTALDGAVRLSLADKPGVVAEVFPAAE